MGFNSLKNALIGLKVAEMESRVCNAYASDRCCNSVDLRFAFRSDDGGMSLFAITLNLLTLFDVLVCYYSV